MTHHKDVRTKLVSSLHRKPDFSRYLFPLISASDEPQPKDNLHSTHGFLPYKDAGVKTYFISCSLNLFVEVACYQPGFPFITAFQHGTAHGTLTKRISIFRWPQKDKCEHQSSTHQPHSAGAPAVASVTSNAVPQIPLIQTLGASPSPRKENPVQVRKHDAWQGCFAASAEQTSCQWNIIFPQVLVSRQDWGFVWHWEEEQGRVHCCS